MANIMISDLGISFDLEVLSPETQGLLEGETEFKYMDFVALVDPSEVALVEKMIGTKRAERTVTESKGGHSPTLIINGVQVASDGSKTYEEMLTKKPDYQTFLETATKQMLRYYIEGLSIRQPKPAQNKSTKTMVPEDRLVWLCGKLDMEFTNEQRDWLETAKGFAKVERQGETLMLTFDRQFYMGNVHACKEFIKHMRAAAGKKSVYFSWRNSYVAIRF